MPNFSESVIKYNEEKTKGNNQNFSVQFFKLTTYYGEFQMYKSRENSIRNPLPIFNNYEL